MIAPLVAAAASLARKTSVAAISSGFTQRDGSACGIAARLAGVSIVLGAIALSPELRRKISEDLEQLGTGVFQVQKWPNGFGQRNWAKIEKRKNFQLADVYFLQAHCQTCLHVAGEAWEGGQAIATGETRSLDEFVEVAFAAVKLDASAHVVSDQGLFRPTDIAGNYASVEKAARVLGWRVKLRMRETVQRLVAAELELQSAGAPR